MASPRFWLGVHRPNWLATAGVPLMVSHSVLTGRRSLPRAVAPWVLDSGGFTQLHLHGRWTVSPTEYVDAARRYQADIGRLTWAAPQDWMCEPFILAKTGLTVDRHQALTVDNFMVLRDLAPDLPFIPVLQGFTLSEYEACVERYRKAGVDLTALDVVGIGSVCRRQATREAAHIIRTISAMGIRLHGFGLKLRAIDSVGDLLASSDSMAWSFDARHRPPMAGCLHKTCANCQRWALRWQTQVMRRIAQPRQLALQIT
jgi:hypothetical protein